MLWIGVCFPLHCHARSPTAEEARLRDLALLAGRFSPMVSLEPPGRMVLEAAGSLRLFDGPGRLLAALRQEIRQAGHKAQLAMAHTPAAALALASAGREIGSDAFADPNKARRQTLKALRTLPLDCIGLDARQCRRLADMGMCDLGALLHLPRRELGNRFGPDLLRMLDRLTGDLPEPRQVAPAPLRFCESLHLLESVSSKPALRLPMQTLVQTLVGWLDHHQLAARNLQWRFTDLSGAHAELKAGFATPESKAENILENSVLSLESCAVSEAVTSLTLTVSDLAPSRPGQFPDIDLLGQQSAAAEMPTAFLDRLAARLPAEAVRRLGVLPDHRPEQALALRSVTDRRRSRMSASGQMSAGPGLASEKGPERPSWLLAEPRPVRRRDYALLRGPERIDCGWWEQPTRRDYFIAEDGAGARCWLFRETNGRRGKWFLHGYFG